MTFVFNQQILVALGLHREGQCWVHAPLMTDVSGERNQFMKIYM